MNLDERLAYRNSLPKFSIWDFSSESDTEPVPEKKLKPSPAEAKKSPEPASPSSSPANSFRATQKCEIQPMTPKLLENLGYVNRNVRPPHSRKNDILTSGETTKTDYSSVLQEHSKKEQKKLENFKAMLNKS